jgi:hypothetical protein
MNEQFNFTFFTDKYDNPTLKKDLTDVINICKNHNVSETFLSFGYRWDTVKQIRNHYMIPLNQIINEVEKYEDCKFGMLGKDELFLRFSDIGFDVQYSYQGDIHINFNTMNSIIQDILNNWDKKDWYYKKCDNRYQGNKD